MSKTSLELATELTCAYIQANGENDLNKINETLSTFKKNIDDIQKVGSKNSNGARVRAST